MNVLPHLLTKISLSFSASVVPLEYIVVVEINISQGILIEQIKSSLHSISLPLQLDNTTEVSGVNITTGKLNLPSVKVVIKMGLC